EIQSLKGLGQELTNTQSFLKGLGSPISGRQLFENFGSGLRNTIRSAFTDGFAGARRSFQDLLKNLAADFLSSQLIRLFRNVFNPQATQTATSTATAAAGQGGGIAGALRSIGNIFLGGLGQSGPAPTSATTPPFNPNASSSGAGAIGAAGVAGSVID